VPIEIPPFAEIALSEAAGGRLRVSFTNAPREGYPMTRIHPTPDAVEVTLAEVERDTDKDGWTDIEERFLQLNWNAADSDGDSIPDGQDAAPSYKERASDQNDDDARVLKRAVFALFGLTESPSALFVRDPSSRPLQFDGLPAPVFYRDAPGGVRVSWKVVERTAADAVVEITDYEGPLAASGTQVKLRRINGAWYVVSIRELWVS
jgi:hypothetical protein